MPKTEVGKAKTADMRMFHAFIRRWVDLLISGGSLNTTSLIASSRYVTSSFWTIKGCS
jgi:hypothetical protein